MGLNSTLGADGWTVSVPAGGIARMDGAGVLFLPDGRRIADNKIGAGGEVSYATWPGVTIDALSSTSGWTLVQTNGAISSDTITLQSGDVLPAINFAPNGAGAPNLLMTKSVSFTYDQSTVIGMWVYVDDPGVVPGIQVLLSNETGGVFTNWKFYTFGGSGGVVFGKRLYWICAPISAFTTGGGTMATSGVALSCRVRVITSYQNRAGTIKCSRLMVSPAARPKVCITFDDGYLTQYSEAFRYMATKGLRGTIGVTTALVGTANYCTWDQLTAMYNAGWDMACHAVDHVGFNSSSINSVCLSQTPASAGNLTLNGSIGSAVFDAPRHVIIRAPDQGRQFTITGLDEFGAAQVESVRAWNASAPVASRALFSQVTQIAIDGASTGALTIGTSLSRAEMYAQMYGCQQALLSRGFTRSAYEWIYPQGEFNTTSEALCSSLGFRSARIVSGQRQSPQVGDFRPYELSGEGGGGASVTGSALNTLRAAAIAEGRNVGFYLHEIIQSGTPTSTQTLMAELKTFIDGCVTDAAAGLCEFVTQSELPVS